MGDKNSPACKGACVRATVETRLAPCLATTACAIASLPLARDPDAEKLKRIRCQRLRRYAPSADFFWVRSCLYVKSDSVHSCTETFSIFQEILRTKSDAGALIPQRMRGQDAAHRPEIAL
jgi:hypothetical protein